MRIKTWHIESLVVLLILAVQLFFVELSWQEIIGSLAVWLTFMHAQVSDRMQEKMAKQAEPDVECYQWSNRYFMGKELLWIVYIAMTGAYAAITGAIVFFLYPIWRKYYRKKQAKEPTQEQMDALLDKYDDLLIDKKYKKVDGLLKSVSVEYEHPRKILGIATITLPFKDNLPSREKFFLRAEKRLGEELTRGLK